MAGPINQWIDECADDIVRALNLLIDDPAQFKSVCGNDPKSHISIEGGHTSINSYALWCATKGLTGKDTSDTVCEIALENLCKSTALIKIRGPLQDVYTVFPPAASLYRKRDHLGGIAFGERYFLKKYRRSIVEIIVHDGNGGFSTATGFITRATSGSWMVITCKHVVFDSSGNIRRIFRINCEEDAVSFKSAIPYSRIDVCILSLYDRPVGACGLSFSHSASVLDEVITAGFPKVMLTKSSPLLYHRGHLNGWTGNPAEVGTSGIISASTAPGCSGGPVFNDYGAVVGIVDQRIETAFEDGDSRYNAMIPVQLVAAEREHLGEEVALKP